MTGYALIEQNPPSRSFHSQKITASCGKNGGESIDRTVSITLGTGCLTHNDRSFIAENVDGNRSHLNVTYCNVPLKETYHKLFDEALEKYNAKQKRADRRIPDYYEKIRLSKQEKLFHEVIVQVGNFADMSAVGENGELAKQILDEYMQGFIKRNYTLHVFSAHLHMDEATPHLHIDFVPIVTNSKRGLETRVSLKQALLALGFEGEGRENTEGTQWTESEKEHLAKVMARYGVRRIDVDKPHEHLSVLDYKKQERTREVEELTEQAQVLQESNDSMRESLEDLKDELSELSEDKDNIHLEMSKYVGEEWELPEVPSLMRAKTYRTKIAQPLITKLKDVIRKLIVNVVEISKMWKQALNEKSRFAGRCRDLERENDSLRKDAKKFGIVRDKLGEDEVQSILQKAEEERLAKEIMKQPSAVGGKTKVRDKTRGNR